MSRENCPHCHAALDGQEGDNRETCPSCGSRLAPSWLPDSLTVAPVRRRQPRQEGPPLPRWFWPALILGPVVAGVVAGLIPSKVLWSGQGILVALGVAGAATAGVGWMTRHWSIEPRLFLTAVAGSVLLAVWFGVGYSFRVGTVYIDNFSDQTLIVYLDGQEWLTCPSGSTTVRSLPPAKYAILVKSTDGRQLDKFRVEVEWVDAYILNLLRAQTYIRGTVHYGNSSSTREEDSEPTLLRSEWIDGEVDYLFQFPPRWITTSSRKSESIRTYLIRINQIPPDDAK